MELKEVIFLLIAGITVLSGWLVVSLKNIIHSAFSLLVSFFGVSGLFVFLHADFLAATQILIYIGGVMILILFSIMLSEKVYNMTIFHRSKFFPALLILGGIFLILMRVILETPWRGQVLDPELSGPTTGTLGELLLNEYLLPFEVISIMLLASLIGAVVLIRKEVFGTEREDMSS